jgi:hypothetical protein
MLSQPSYHPHPAPHLQSSHNHILLALTINLCCSTSPVCPSYHQKYYYYHLWHPLDHVEAAWSLGPAVPIIQKGPPLYTLIHERYR